MDKRQTQALGGLTLAGAQRASEALQRALAPRYNLDRLRKQHNLTDAEVARAKPLHTEKTRNFEECVAQVVAARTPQLSRVYLAVRQALS